MPLDVEVLRLKLGLSKTDLRWRFILDELVCTPAQIRVIKRAPQKSEEWLKARSHRLTASNFGAAVGHNKYEYPADMCNQKLCNTFQGNAMTAWGNDHEDDGRTVYMVHLKARYRDHSRSNGWPDSMIRVKETGLIVIEEYPFIGVSPDGIVTIGWEKGLLEIKCPYSKRPYPEIPHYYYDQIQGLMGFLNLPWCDFVVWTPTWTYITRYPFDKPYFENVLKPGLIDWFVNLYLPRYFLHTTYKDMDIPVVIDINDEDREQLAEQVEFVYPPRPESQRPLKRKIDDVKLEDFLSDFSLS